MNKLAWIILFFSSSVFAGVMNGGGGKGILCRDSDHNIKSVELMDLWEARVIYGREFSDTHLDTRSQVNRLLDKLKTSLDTDGMYLENRGIVFKGPEAFKQLLLDQAELYLSDIPYPGVHWISGATLKLTDDSYEVVVPNGCEVVQLARYSDNGTGGTVLLNKDLVDKMDNMNKAALIVHEEYYAHIRHRKRLGEKSSIRVRRAIGLAASDYKFINPRDFMVGKPHIFCADNENSIFIYQTKDKAGFSIFPDMISGRIAIDFKEDWVTLTTSVDELFKPYTTQVYETLGNVGYDYSYSIKLVLDDKKQKYADVKLISAPDDEDGTGEVRLPCHSWP